MEYVVIVITVSRANNNNKNTRKLTAANYVTLIWLALTTISVSHRAAIIL